MSLERPIRTVKSYVCRSRVTDRQQIGLDNYWSLYGLEQNNQLIDFKSIFAEEAPTILEIGFGMGRSLIEMAKTRRDINFIGIDVHLAGVGAILSDIHAHQLTNIRIFKTDAVEILKKALPDASFAAILLFFPDPWPKKRHHKRRIVQPEFVDLVHTKLSKGGYFHLATDIENYAQHMSKVVNLHSGFHNDETAPSKLQPLVRPRTKFESRGERKGHVISDLIYFKS